MDLIGWWNSGAVSWRAVFDRAQARSEKYRENCNTISHLQYVLRNNDHKPNTAQNGQAVSCDYKNLQWEHDKHLSRQLITQALTCVLVQLIFFNKSLTSVPWLTARPEKLLWDLGLRPGRWLQEPYSVLLWYDHHLQMSCPGPPTCEKAREQHILLTPGLHLHS